MPLLLHEPHAAGIDSRYIAALRRNGVSTWEQLVKVATTSPSPLYSYRGIGEAAISQIKIALGSARVEHTLTKKRGKKRG